MDLGGRAGAGGDLRSNKSPILLDAAGWPPAIWLPIGDVTADEKSPKSPPTLSFRLDCVGGDDGFGGGAGFMSKKLPPLNGLGVFIELCLEWLDEDVRLENGAGFVCDVCGEAKERDENASFSPPRACVFVWLGEVNGGDCIPPNTLTLEPC